MIWSKAENIEMGKILLVLSQGIFLFVSTILLSGCAEDLATPDGKSTNLQRDLALMWETKPLRASDDPTHPPNARRSTDRAIQAAGRVFSTVNLIGKSGDEVWQILGKPQEKSDSMYNFPFYPAPQKGLVFRFDNGAWGMQYNLKLDADGRVTKVELLAIE
jgi:hypothetical protein